jgi:hypothetical protein
MDAPSEKIVKNEELSDANARVRVVKLVFSAANFGPY